MKLAGNVVAIDKELPLAAGRDILINDDLYDIESIVIEIEDDHLAISIYVKDHN